MYTHLRLQTILARFDTISTSSPPESVSLQRKLCMLTPEDSMGRARRTYLHSPRSQSRAACGRSLSVMLTRREDIVCAQQFKRRMNECIEKVILVIYSVSEISEYLRDLRGLWLSPGDLHASTALRQAL